MSVPSAANKVFWGVNVNFWISGQQYAAVGNIGIGPFGYQIHTEPVLGTTAPYLGTGHFVGTLSIEALAAHDLPFFASGNSLIHLTANQLDDWKVQWRATDGQVSGRVFTISGVKFHDPEIISDRDSVVKFRIKGIFPQDIAMSGY